jgi:hypothetical protein
MQLQDRVAKLRSARRKEGEPAVPGSFQGVSKARIREVLSSIDLGNEPDIVDGIFALLDDETASWFSRAPKGASFATGAATAHLGCHIGILQRGKSKLDREGRDKWIKPLRELGAIEAVFLNSKTQEFVSGHPVAKSPNSAYRLAGTFKAILQADQGHWEQLLKEWISASAARARRQLQAELGERSRRLVDNKHSDLINSCIEHYARQFLPGYEVIYVDDSDGDRVTDEDRVLLQKAGVSLGLQDAMPDVLLWNSKTDWLWVIEAVTSDGEVDFHKFRQLTELASRSGKIGIGFTTAYRSWKEAAARQHSQKNLASDTYLWIQEEPGKHLLIKTRAGQ